MARPIPQVCIDFLKKHERCVLYVYDDARFPTRPIKPVDNIIGKLTAGYGHTGPQVEPGMEVTQSQADAWLEQDLAIARSRLAGVIGKIIDELTAYQYAALLSFVFNLGSKPEWTIWKRLKAREFDQIPLEMMKFVNQTRTVNGKKELVKVSGLVARRAAEVQLWATDEPGSVTAAPPSSVTRTVETPPTPADPKPPAKSGGIIAAAGAAVASAPVVLDQVSHAIAPYAEHSEWVSRGLAVLAFLTAAAAVTAMVLMWMHQKHLRQ